MTLLNQPLNHTDTVDMSFSGEKEQGMKADHVSISADTRFLKAILAGLTFITCMLGAAVVMAMP